MIRDLPAPYLAFSTTDTAAHRTGTWRHLRPAFDGAPAPCALACPAGVDVRRFLERLAAGDDLGALATVLAANPMPGVTGRVCPHPCERRCNRQEIDAAVAIRDLERVVDRPAGAVLPMRAPPSGRSVAVVGSGPAGLSCAWHLALRGHAVRVFEAERHPGGLLRLGIPAYRLPRAAVSRVLGRLEAVGVVLATGRRLGRDLHLDDLASFDAAFVALGAHRSQALEVPGGTGPGVVPALGFLREVALGRGRRPGGHVAVVGGGNTAVDAARTALRLGARATIVYRRTRDEIPAFAEEVDGAEAEGVRLLFLAAPERVERDRAGRVRALVCRAMRLGEPDGSGRRRPVPVRRTVRLPVDAVLVATGEWPDAHGLAPLGPDGRGVVGVDASQRTVREGFFAGGDVAGEPRTVAHAIGSGRRAAESIDAWLARREVPAAVAPAAPARVRVDHFTPQPRVEGRVALAPPRRGGFRELGRALPRGLALAEAGRCARCGSCTRCDVCARFCPDVSIERGPGPYAFDLEHCKGCGICAVECPRGVIAMHPEREAEAREGLRGRQS